jgi:orotidine-5'-phosphate decarboxylase
MIPDDVLVIDDAKRCDIGSSARHYAAALYDRLAADSDTVSPFMGRDSVEPFLAYRECLTFFLVLTSNPGAQDFLLPNGLYRDIARRIDEWNTDGNCGIVAGATRPEQLAELRQAAPSLPFLVPGSGTQGGDIHSVLRNGLAPDAEPSLVLHVSRGILPMDGEAGHPGEAIHQRTRALVDQIRAARPEKD